MPVLREPRNQIAALADPFGHGGEPIRVRCPKCQSRFSVTAGQGGAVRCTKCRYPMLKQQDIHQIIEACRRNVSPAQLSNAFNLLSQLSESSPEACVALNELVNNNNHLMSVQDRWGKLMQAYGKGEHSAVSSLNKLCESDYHLYKNTRCRHCGAIKYDVHHPETAVCVYCLRAD